MEYTFESIMTLLESLGDEKRKAYCQKMGFGDNAFGVTMGALRPLAKKIKTNHAVALRLWESGNYEAMILATMIMETDLIIENDFENILEGAYHSNLVDELTFRAFHKNVYAKTWMHIWILNEDGKFGRAGWNLAIDLLGNHQVTEIEIDDLLSLIEKDMKDAQVDKQWAMNHFMCAVGIQEDQYTDKCLALGERLGVYKELKVSKGCTSAYALAWIPVGRAKKGK